MKTVTDNQLKQKRTSKGKAKIPIALIADKTARHVCFSKRRPGLFKKCSKLCSLFPGTQFGAITFSIGGKPFSHGYPSFDSVISRFLNDNRQDNTSNWWEASVDEMKLEELEEFVVALEGLQNGVVSRVAELDNRVHESETGFNADRQLANYYEQSTQNFKVKSYDFPDTKFSDYSPETMESFDLEPVNGNVGTLFDVIKGINFGCNDATVRPKSDTCKEFMEIIDYETIDATPGPHASDFSSEIQSIDNDATVCPNSEEIIDFETAVATPDAQASDFSSEIQSIDNNATVCPNSENCQEFMEIIDFETVDATPDPHASDFSSEIQSIDNDATVGPNSEKCQEFMEIVDFETVDATPDAQGYDISPEIQSIDFGSNDETFSPQFNSEERRNSFDLTEVLKSVDAECNIKEQLVNASVGAQMSDNSPWMNDSYFLSALGCC